MTREYAILSVRVGCVAAAIAEYAGDEVVRLVRLAGGNLTEEWLEALKLIALQQNNVPMGAIDAAEEEARRICSHSALMEAFMKLQDEIGEP